jgi:hypothetical protein
MDGVMTMRNLIRCGVLGAVIAVGGCTSQTGPDTNTGVFKTPEQAADARRQKLLLDWQEMALRIANADRPDVRTIKPPAGFALMMSADGVEQTVDLSPLTEQLTSAVGREREPLRAYLAQKWPAFDRARLKAIGFERARPMLRPVLANMKQLGAMTLVDTRQPPITNRVVTDLNWVPVVRWPGTESAQTAVDAELARAWGVSADQVGATALANLKAEFEREKGMTFETVDLPALGRYGTLRGGADAAAYLLLPEWLASVRREWKTTDDLVVSLPSRSTASFLERKNERLLSQLAPEWNKRLAQSPDAMLSTMLLVGDGGMSLFQIQPANAAATKPATAPTTKRVYIVH